LMSTLTEVIWRNFYLVRLLNSATCKK
jgi:hypothetical protein